MPPAAWLSIRRARAALMGKCVSHEIRRARWTRVARIRTVAVVRRCCRAAFVFSVAAALAGGCARIHPPENAQTALYDLEKTGESDRADLTFAKSQCAPPGTTHFMVSAPNRRDTAAVSRIRMRYSPGDRFNLFIPGSPEFSGDYVINADGLVVLPFSSKVSAVGLSDEQLSKKIEDALLRNGMFRGSDFQVSVRPVQYAAINITVAGAVFLPGRVVIGGVKDSDKGEKVLNKSGDYPGDRFVAAALRAGGGVRPDADLSRVKLHRDKRVITLDWRGAITGARVDDVALIEGDHIEVEEAGCFQSELVRPSQITPPGIRIFQSNLTQPVLTNAASAIGQQSQNIPYGTRFLAGLVSSNCVGGSLASNARRYGVLISRNPKTHRTEVIQRSIEELVRSADRDSINPYLMPDDAIACYDSGITDMKEVANWAQTLLLPSQTAQGLLRW
ncbi:MAG: polysaccharide export protein [Hyphomicrobiales bacterium]|nr:MAG: polysaccharide export protein [Hyphomicrobiales bacterium]